MLTARGLGGWVDGRMGEVAGWGKEKNGARRDIIASGSFTAR
jgi:hypothetical protein